MRKYHLVLIGLFGLGANAQIYTPGNTTQGSTNSQNVGIGTSQTQAKLHVKSRDGMGIVLDVGVAGPLIGGGFAQTTYPFELRYSNSTGLLANGASYPLNEVRLRMHNNGRLDLGSTFQAFPLRSNSRLNVMHGMTLFGSSSNYMFMHNNSIRWYNNGHGHFKISHGNANNSLGRDLFSIDPNGAATFTGNATINDYLAISTSTIVGDYKLFVGGAMLAEEVVVKLQADWPDYVFMPNYPLMPLEDLERFVLKNQRLPNIPSAKTVAKEGQNLGENQKVLVEKIEELTLYLIAINKELEKAKAKIEALENAQQL